MRKEHIDASDLDALRASVHDELEKGASAARVREIADAHPNFRAEILDFAAAWLASDGSDLSDDMRLVGQTVPGHSALLERFWEAAEHGASDPFAKLPPKDLKAIAERCHLDMAVLRQLVRGFIDVDTIPGKLVAWLADATSVRTAELWSFLSSPALATGGGRDFFAPGGKRSPDKVSFADVIRNSQLPEADKQFWLAHLEA